ncbi:MAG: NAD-dependent epimerase/dehydratase family protein [Gammaproteobacteria bacterium]|jgi:UDP-glucose 4-epimerase
MNGTRCALVTGANGFVGRRLSEQLHDAGARVRALLRRPVAGPWDETIYGDLGDTCPASEWFNGVDTVYHAAGIAHSAAQATSSRDVYFRVNVEGSRELADAAAAAGVERFVYWSSVKAMGEPGEDCVDEDWPYPPQDVYGVSKREAETAVLSVGETTGMHVSVLRPALVYGPGVKGNLFRMMEQIDCGRFPPLPETGNRRSMVHVDDLVQAARLAASTPAARGRVYIVTDGEVYSTRRIYDALCRGLNGQVSGWAVPGVVLSALAKAGDLFELALRKAAPINSVVVGKLLGSACYDSRRIREELGFRPGWTFEEAVDAMVDAYRIARVPA